MDIAITALCTLYSIFRRVVSPEFSLCKGSFVSRTSHFGGGFDSVDEKASIVTIVYCDSCEPVSENFIELATLGQLVTFCSHVKK